MNNQVHIPIVEELINAESHIIQVGAWMRNYMDDTSNLVSSWRRSMIVSMMMVAMRVRRSLLVVNPEFRRRISNNPTKLA